jgi:hypothetical protein
MERTRPRNFKSWSAPVPGAREGCTRRYARETRALHVT